MKNNNIVCPVDFVTVNEYKIRVIAFLVFTLSIIFIVTDYWIIAAFMCADFFLRAFVNGKLSVLSYAANYILAKTLLGNKPVDRAPKKFAAQIGFALTLFISISSVINYNYSSFIGVIILIIFSSLESFIGFCAGCYIYHFYQKIIK
ncbi:MAG: DUF4395 domain-containing protein [Bacteroidetes bacterium]|nr:DUF4395 domain-containing protein [Bacteroidota bacterium]MBS1590658.1 DUF4395 domain-containing protein [Bacteroidota bacterium]